MTASIPSAAMMTVFVLLILLLIFALTSLCWNDCQINKKLRISMVISLSLQLSLLFIQYQSIYITPNQSEITRIMYILYYSNLLVVSIVGFYLIHSPKLAPKDTFSFFLNHFWRFITIIHILHTSAALTIYLMTDNPSYGNIYFYGFSMYILCAAIVVLLISIKLKNSIKDSIEKLYEMNQTKYEEYVFDVDAEAIDLIMRRESQISVNDFAIVMGEEHDNNNHTIREPTKSPTKSTPDSSRIPQPHQTYAFHRIQASDSPITPVVHPPQKCKQLIDPLHKIVELTNAKNRVNVLMALTIFLICTSFGLFYWNFSVGFKDYDFCRLDVFIVHYALMLMIYISITIHHWTLPGKRFHGLCCLQSKVNVNGSKRDPNKTSNDSTPNKNRSNCTGTGSKKSDKNSKSDGSPVPTMEIANFAKQTALSLVIQHSNNQSITEEIYEDRYQSPSPSLPNLPMLSDGESVVSHTDQTRNELSESHLKIPLGNINHKGEILGKRGAKKPNRMNRTHSNNHLFPPTIQEYVNRRNVLHESTLNDITKRIPSTKSKYGNSLNCDPASTSGMTNTRKFVFDEILDDVLDTMSLSEIDTTPITTVVLELNDVLCTQPDKLKGKDLKDLEDLNLTQKQLLFGGPDRIDALIKWLTELSANNPDLQFFVNTEEATKTIVQLLMDVGLLKFFISRKQNEPKKLISHVIGYNHRIARDTESKRHLILLELLKFLQRSHQSMLYIANDKQVIEHLDNIQLCKIYHVEQKGLTQNDLDDIQEFYF